MGEADYMKVINSWSLWIDNANPVNCCYLPMLGDNILWLDSLCGNQIPCCVQLHTFTRACRHGTLGVIPETQVKSQLKI